MTIAQWNKAFELSGQLQCVSGPGGLPMIEIDNGLARCRISLYAGQVLSFQPAGVADDLLFVSERAYYAEGKAIKGGVPICWPWFGADPEGLGRPAHGVVRNRHWTVQDTSALPGGETLVTLGFAAGDDVRLWWPHAFSLRLMIKVGKVLELRLVTENQAEQPWPLTQAFHTYFKVGDIRRVKVLGLEGRDYLDKAKSGGGERKTQTGAVCIDGEVDRIYVDTAGDLLIDDAAGQRRIRIQSSGSQSAVVWNPGAAIAASMADLQDDDYERFLCVETTNAASDAVILVPGARHELRAVYAIEQG